MGYLVQHYIVDRLQRGKQRDLLQQGSILTNYCHPVEFPSIYNDEKKCILVLFFIQNLWKKCCQWWSVSPHRCRGAALLLSSHLPLLYASPPAWCTWCPYVPARVLQLHCSPLGGGLSQRSILCQEALGKSRNRPPWRHCSNTKWREESQLKLKLKLPVIT